MTRSVAATPVYDVMGATVAFLTPAPPASAPFCVMRGVIPPRTSVPMHSHPAAESFFVVSGEAQVLLEHDGRLEWRDVKPGDFVHIPSDAKHAHRNGSSTSVNSSSRSVGTFRRRVLFARRQRPMSGALPPLRSGTITGSRHRRRTPQSGLRCRKGERAEVAERLKAAVC